MFFKQDFDFDLTFFPLALFFLCCLTHMSSRMGEEMRETLKTGRKKSLCQAVDLCHNCTWIDKSIMSVCLI